MISLRPYRYIEVYLRKRMNGEVEYKTAMHYNFKYLKLYLHSNLIASDKKLYKMF